MQQHCLKSDRQKNPVPRLFYYILHMIILLQLGGKWLAFAAKRKLNSASFLQNSVTRARELPHR